jgi:hypothetical protein
MLNELLAQRLHVPALRKGGPRTCWGAHTITFVKRKALCALRTTILSGAIEQDNSLLVLDNCFKDAIFKDMPVPVAFTSPTMSSELHKLKESGRHWGATVIRQTTHPVSCSFHFEAMPHRCRRGSNPILSNDISTTPSPTSDLSIGREINRKGDQSEGRSIVSHPIVKQNVKFQPHEIQPTHHGTLFLSNDYYWHIC